MNLFPQPKELQIFPATSGREVLENRNFVKNEALASQEYILRIDENGVTVESSTDQGAFYAELTLKQMADRVKEMDEEQTALEEKITKAKNYKKIITLGYLCAGAFSAFSIGMNSSANVTALYYDFTAKGANLLTNAQLTATIGGIAIAIGVLTYSKKVMMTVGSSIVNTYG